MRLYEKFDSQQVIAALHVLTVFPIIVLCLII